MRAINHIPFLCSAIALAASPIYAAGNAPVLSSSLNPSKIGDAVTFEVNYDHKLVGGPDLQFLVDGTVIGTVPPENITTPSGKERGKVSFTTSNLTGGTHTVTVQPVGGWLSTSIQPNSLVQHVFLKKYVPH